MSQTANAELSRIFGLDGKRVFEMTLHARAPELPTLTTKRHLMTINDAGELDQITEVFDLVLRKPKAPDEWDVAREKVRRMFVSLRSRLDDRFEDIADLLEENRARISSLA
jgi:hypothetical protein